MVVAQSRFTNLREWRENFWKRIAFITRYGRATFSEALDMSIREGEEFSNAIAGLIEGENKLPNSED